MSDTLQQIRDLQFRDRGAAEGLLLSFLRAELDMDAVSVRLTPKPTSLNSFNGFVTLNDGVEKFFKTHTETHTVIEEYYNAGMLAQAGYPIIQPTFQSSRTGRQILLYDVIHEDAVFDVAWQIEQGQTQLVDRLRVAQNEEDKALYERYERTLKSVSATENAAAPVHQLFWHRLTGGRLANFYSNSIDLPGQTYTMSEVIDWHWVINGQHYNTTLKEIIRTATQILDPQSMTYSIVGHGDAHNGNVFLRHQHEQHDLLYFDPAFAGRHDPLLDLAKPLFHNVFAMWMYYPQEKAAQTAITWRLENGVAQATYDYLLADVRRLFLDSKVTYTLIPILRLLKQQGHLRTDWKLFLKAALFCCPFLTMNLSDSTRFTPSIALLGLCMSVEMGADSLEIRSLLDTVLNTVEQHL